MQIKVKIIFLINCKINIIHKIRNYKIKLIQKNQRKKQIFRISKI
jgi:hypothetical protein